MAIQVRKIRLVNPSKRSAKARKHGAKENPAQLLTLGFINPTRSSKVKSKTKKKHARRKSNPAVVFARSHKQFQPKPRRRRNPSPLSRPVDALKSGAFALVGLVATRQIPQVALNAKNAGLIGYLANGATALGTAAVIAKAAGKEAAQATLIGGAMYIANRLLNEFASPVGKYLSLSGIGDPHAATLGDIRSGYYPLPVPTTGGQAMQAVLPSAITSLAAPVPTATSARPLSGVVRSGGSSRFNSRF